MDNSIEMINSLQARPKRPVLKGVAAGVCLAFTLTQFQTGWAGALPDSARGRASARAKLAPPTRLGDAGFRAKASRVLDARAAASRRPLPANAPRVAVAGDPVSVGLLDRVFKSDGWRVEPLSFSEAAGRSPTGQTELFHRERMALVWWGEAARELFQSQNAEGRRPFASFLKSRKGIPRVLILGPSSGAPAPALEEVQAQSGSPLNELFDYVIFQLPGPDIPTTVDPEAQALARKTAQEIAAYGVKALPLFKPFRQRLSRRKEKSPLSRTGIIRRDLYRALNRTLKWVLIDRLRTPSYLPPEQMEVLRKALLGRTQQYPFSDFDRALTSKALEESRGLFGGGETFWRNFLHEILKDSHVAQEVLPYYLARWLRYRSRNQAMLDEIEGAIAPSSSSGEPVEQILVLGVGFGFELVDLLARYPKADIVAVDMDARAAEKSKALMRSLGIHEDRVLFPRRKDTRSDYIHLDRILPLPKHGPRRGGDFDRVFIIHPSRLLKNHRDLETVARVAEAAAKRLKENGRFILVAREADWQANRAYRSLVRRAGFQELDHKGMEFLEYLMIFEAQAEKILIADPSALWKFAEISRSLDKTLKPVVERVGRMNPEHLRAWLKTPEHLKERAKYPDFFARIGDLLVLEGLITKERQHPGAGHFPGRAIISDATKDLSSYNHDFDAMEIWAKKLFAEQSFQERHDPYRRQLVQAILNGDWNLQKNLIEKGRIAHKTKDEEDARKRLEAYDFPHTIPLAEGGYFHANLGNDEYLHMASLMGHEQFFLGWLRQSLLPQKKDDLAWFAADIRNHPDFYGSYGLPLEPAAMIKKLGELPGEIQERALKAIHERFRADREQKRGYNWMRIHGKLVYADPIYGLLAANGSEILEIDLTLEGRDWWPAVRKWEGLLSEQDEEGNWRLSTAKGFAFGKLFMGEGSPIGTQLPPGIPERGRQLEFSVRLPGSGERVPLVRIHLDRGEVQRLAPTGEIQARFKMPETFQDKAEAFWESNRWTGFQTLNRRRLEDLLKQFLPSDRLEPKLHRQWRRFEVRYLHGYVDEEYPQLHGVKILLTTASAGLAPAQTMVVGNSYAASAPPFEVYPITIVHPLDGIVDRDFRPARTILGSVHAGLNRLRRPLHQLHEILEDPERLRLLSRELAALEGLEDPSEIQQDLQRLVQSVRKTLFQEIRPALAAIERSPASTEREQAEKEKSLRERYEALRVGALEPLVEKIRPLTGLKGSGAVFRELYDTAAPLLRFLRLHAWMDDEGRMHGGIVQVSREELLDLMQQSVIDRLRHEVSEYLLTKSIEEGWEARPGEFERVTRTFFPKSPEAKLETNHKRKPDPGPGAPPNNLPGFFIAFLASAALLGSGAAADAAEKVSGLLAHPAIREGAGSSNGWKWLAWVLGTALAAGASWIISKVRFDWQGPLEPPEEPGQPEEPEGSFDPVLLLGDLVDSVRTFNDNLDSIESSGRKPPSRQAQETLLAWGEALASHEKLLPKVNRLLPQVSDPDVRKGLEALLLSHDPGLAEDPSEVLDRFNRTVSDPSTRLMALRTMIENLDPESTHLGVFESFLEAGLKDLDRLPSAGAYEEVALSFWRAAIDWLLEIENVDAREARADRLEKFLDEWKGIDPAIFAGVMRAELSVLRHSDQAVQSLLNRAWEYAAEARNPFSALFLACVILKRGVEAGLAMDELPFSLDRFVQMLRSTHDYVDYQKDVTPQNFPDLFWIVQAAVALHDIPGYSMDADELVKNILELTEKMSDPNLRVWYTFSLLDEMAKQREWLGTVLLLAHDKNQHMPLAALHMELLLGAVPDLLSLENVRAFLERYNAREGDRTGDTMRTSADLAALGRVLPSDVFEALIADPLLSLEIKTYLRLGALKDASKDRGELQTLLRGVEQGQTVLGQQPESAQNTLDLTALGKLIQYLKDRLALFLVFGAGFFSLFVLHPSPLVLLALISAVLFGGVFMVPPGPDPTGLPLGPADEDPAADLGKLIDASRILDKRLDALQFPKTAEKSKEADQIVGLWLSACSAHPGLLRKVEWRKDAIRDPVQQEAVSLMILLEELSAAPLDALNKLKHAEWEPSRRLEVLLALLEKLDPNQTPRDVFEAFLWAVLAEVEKIQDPIEGGGARFRVYRDLLRWIEAVQDPQARTERVERFLFSMREWLPGRRTWEPVLLGRAALMKQDRQGALELLREGVGSPLGILFTSAAILGTAGDKAVKWDGFEAVGVSHEALRAILAELLSKPDLWDAMRTDDLLLTIRSAVYLDEMAVYRVDARRLVVKALEELSRLKNLREREAALAEAFEEVRRGFPGMRWPLQEIFANLIQKDAAGKKVGMSRLASLYIKEVLRRQPDLLGLSNVRRFLGTRPSPATLIVLGRLLPAEVYKPLKSDPVLPSPVKIYLRIGYLKDAPLTADQARDLLTVLKQEQGASKAERDAILRFVKFMGRYFLPVLAGIVPVSLALGLGQPWMLALLLAAPILFGSSMVPPTTEPGGTSPNDDWAAYRLSRERRRAKMLKQRAQVFPPRAISIEEVTIRLEKRKRVKKLQPLFPGGVITDQNLKEAFEIYMARNEVIEISRKERSQESLAEVEAVGEENLAWGQKLLAAFESKPALAEALKRSSKILVRDSDSLADILRKDLRKLAFFLAGDYVDDVSEIYESSDPARAKQLRRRAIQIYQHLIAQGAALQYLKREGGTQVLSAHQQLSEAYLKEGNYAEAIRTVREGMDLQKKMRAEGNGSGSLYFWLLFRLGKIFIRRADQDQEEGRLWRAKLNYQRGLRRMDEALRLTDDIQRYHLPTSQVHVQRGNAWYSLGLMAEDADKQKQAFEKSLACAKAAYQEAPSDPAALASLGVAEGQLEQFGPSVVHLSQSLEQIHLVGIVNGLLYALAKLGSWNDLAEEIVLAAEGGYSQSAWKTLLSSASEDGIVKLLKQLQNRKDFSLQGVARDWEALLQEKADPRVAKLHQNLARVMALVFADKEDKEQELHRALRFPIKHWAPHLPLGGLADLAKTEFHRLRERAAKKPKSANPEDLRALLRAISTKDEASRETFTKLLEEIAADPTIKQAAGKQAGLAGLRAEAEKLRDQEARLAPLIHEYPYVSVFEILERLNSGLTEYKERLTVLMEDQRASWLGTYPELAGSLGAVFKEAAAKGIPREGLEPFLKEKAEDVRGLRGYVDRLLDRWEPGLSSVLGRQAREEAASMAISYGLIQPGMGREPPTKSWEEDAAAQLAFMALDRYFKKTWPFVEELESFRTLGRREPELREKLVSKDFKYAVEMGLSYFMEELILKYSFLTKERILGLLRTDARGKATLEEAFGSLPRNVKPSGGSAVLPGVLLPFSVLAYADPGKHPLPLWVLFAGLGGVALAILIWHWLTKWLAGDPGDRIFVISVDGSEFLGFGTEEKAKVRAFAKSVADLMEKGLQVVIAYNAKPGSEPGSISEGFPLVHELYEQIFQRHLMRGVVEIRVGTSKEEKGIPRYSPQEAVKMIEYARSGLSSFILIGDFEGAHFAASAAKKLGAKNLVILGSSKKTEDVQVAAQFVESGSGRAIFTDPLHFNLENARKLDEPARKIDGEALLAQQP